MKLSVLLHLLNENKTKSSDQSCLTTLYTMEVGKDSKKLDDNLSVTELKVEQNTDDFEEQDTAASQTLFINCLFINCLFINCQLSIIINKDNRLCINKCHWCTYAVPSFLVIL